MSYGSRLYVAAEGGKEEPLTLATDIKGTRSAADRAYALRLGEADSAF